MMNDKDRAICRELVTRGEIVLYERGYDKYERKQFMERREVKKEIEFQTQQWKDRKGIQERHAFMAQLDLFRMIPASLTIIASSLRGEQVEKDKEGKRLKKDPPTDQQFRAAVEILNRTGVGSRSPDEWSENMKIALLQQNNNSVSIGGDDADSMVAREKVRTLFEKLAAGMKQQEKRDFYITHGRKSRKAVEREQPGERGTEE